MSNTGIAATREARPTIDDLAQEIRRVDGENGLGAGALAEALWPFWSTRGNDKFDRDENIDALVDSWRVFIRERAQLLSFLYDIDLLPEQIHSWRGADMLDAVCSLYQAAEEGAITAKPKPAEGANHE